MTKNDAIEVLIQHAKRCPEPEPTAHGCPEDIRDDFVAFCEAVGGQPLTPQQRLLAEVLSDQQKGMFLRAFGQQKNIPFIQGLHKRFMQGERAESVVMNPRPPRIHGHKAGLLIVDDCEAATKESHED